MYTTISSGNSDSEIAQLKSQLAQYQSEASSLQSRLDELNAENSELLRKMSKATTTEEYEGYRATYNANKSKIDDLQKQLDTVNSNISSTQQAILDAQEGEKQQTDDYTRIPQIMKSMKDSYGITWNNDGSWTGNTFIREGTVGSVKGSVTFKATISIARKPKYFLGIKIHRAIVQIDWELTSSWSDSHVAEVMELNPDNSDEENARLVNQKMSELARAYPDCEITVEYSKTPGMEVEDTDGTYHLLWASDRLEIARGIEARLARIYTDLVMVEKFLHYRHTYKMWIRDLLPKLNADKDRKQSIAEKSRRQWMHNGGSAYYTLDDEEE